MAAKQEKFAQPATSASVGVLLLGFGAALIGYLIRRPLPAADRPPPESAGTGAGPRLGSAGHVPVDLLGTTHPNADHRAPVEFRPDPTAPIAPEDRDALRPATRPI